MNKAEPTFDIFHGSPDQDVMWIAAVAGLANACGAMKQLAAQKPGRYFVFSGKDCSILAEINTSQPVNLNPDAVHNIA